MARMDLIVSDFDNTLFKRYHGLIEENVKKLEDAGYPIYIVTYRAEDQHDFIAEILAGTKLNIIGYGFAGSRNQDPATKVEIIRNIMTRHNVVDVLDDDKRVVLCLNRR